MRKEVELAVLIVLALLLASSAYAMPNPSAWYCTDLGYEYIDVKEEDGSERGICRIEGQDCDAWEFYSGKCLPEKSACARNGYATMTASEGEDPYSQEYSVCVESQDAITGFATLVSERGGSFTEWIKSLASQLLTGMAVDELNTTETAPARVLASNLTSLAQQMHQKSVTFAPKEEPAAPTQSQAATLQSAGIESIPASFDWRNNNGNWVTPVKNQGGCGSCWAFGATSVAEAAIKIGRGDQTFNPDLSEQEVLSCSGAGDCGGGYHYDALSWIRSNGLTDEGCMPYSASDQSCSAYRCGSAAKRKWKIDSYDYDYYPEDSSVRGYIVNHGPVAANFCYDGYFSGDIYRCSGDEWPWFYLSCSGHVVTLVGYDNAGGYWIAKNSWGSTWNGNGYFKIGYGECGIGDSIISYVTWADRTWPYFSDSVGVSQIENITGSYSGSMSNMNTRDGTYLTLQDKCSGSTCSGTSILLHFNQSKLPNPQRMDIMANVRGRDANDFNFYHLLPPSTWTVLGSWPQTSTSWALMKYSICSTPAECSALFSSNKLTTLLSHASCTSCDIDYADVDWLVVETELDTDGDGVTDSNDACKTSAGTWCHGCPQPNCGSCSYNPTCPSMGAPYCASYNTTTAMCNSTYRCSAALGNNNYGLGGEYNCKGYCDGTGSCDYASSCYYSTVCDPDDDNDGVLDGSDLCPSTPNGATVNTTNGCSQAQVDTDLDGTCNPGGKYAFCRGSDACPTVNATYCNGCPYPSNGTCKTSPVCPASGVPYFSANASTAVMCDQSSRCSIGMGDNNYNKQGENSCLGYCDGGGSCDYANSCSYSASCDADDDNDGVADVNDTCASTPAGNATDVNGCAKTQVDTDKDAVCNTGKTSPLWCSGTDLCSSTAEGATVDDKGCSQAQVDTDLDGLCNPGNTSTLCSGSDSCQAQSGPSCNNGCPDSTPPQIRLVGPVNTTYSTRTVLINVTGGDICIDSVTLFNGTENMTVTLPYIAYWEFPKGNTTIVAYSNDTTGNTNYSSANFRIAYKPGIDIQSLENKTYFTRTIMLNVSVDEHVYEINTTFDEVNHSLLCRNCENAILNLELEEGVHNSTVYVTDFAGDMFNQTFNFSIDTSAPMINSYNYRDKQEVDGNATTLFVVNYTELLLEKVRFGLNLAEEPVAGCISGTYRSCSITKDLTGYAHGENVYFYFKMNDTSGRDTVLLAQNASGPYKVVIDRNAPEITINNIPSHVGYKASVNITLDEEATIVYSLDGGLNNSVCLYCREAMPEINGLAVGKHVLKIWTTDEFGHVNSTTLTLDAVPDFNRDGTPDLLGNESEIDTNLANLSFEINGSKDLTIEYGSIANVTFKQNGTTIMEFEHNFTDRQLNLSNISIMNSSTAEKGAIIIKGIDLGERTKTVFVDHISSTLSTICIKDAEVLAISEISSGCSAADEYYLSCPGTIAGYGCELNGSRYKVTGLHHSAIQELYVASSPPTGGGGGGGGSTTATTFKITPTQEGAAAALSTTSRAVLVIDGAEYPLRIDSVDYTDVMLIINSYYYTVGLLERTINVDVDKDSKMDVTIELVKSEKGVATLLFKIYTPPKLPTLLPPASTKKKAAMPEETKAETEQEVMQPAAQQEIVIPTLIHEEQPIEEQPAIPGGTALVVVGLILLFMALTLILSRAWRMRKKTSPAAQPATQEKKPAEEKPVKTKTVEPKKAEIKKEAPKPLEKPKKEEPKQKEVLQEGERPIEKINDDIARIRQHLKEKGF